MLSVTEQRYIKDKKDLEEIRNCIESSQSHIPRESIPGLIIRTITEYLPVPFWVKDSHGAYLYVNNQWEYEFGARLEDVLYLVDEQIWKNSGQAISYRENDKKVLASGQELITVEVVGDGCFGDGTCGGDGEEWVVRKFPIYWKEKSDLPVKVGGFAIRLVVLDDIKGFL